MTWREDDRHRYLRRCWLKALLAIALPGNAVAEISRWVAARTLPTPLLLDAFSTSASAGYESSPNTELSDYRFARSAEGNVRLVGNGRSGTMYVRKTTSSSILPADMGVVAWMVRRNSGSYNGIQATQTRGANTGTVTYEDHPSSWRGGRRWVAGHVSEFGGFSAGAVGKVTYQISANQVAPYDADVVVGPVYQQAAGRPSVLFTFDDVRDEQINNVFPLMQARGMKATVYAVKKFTGSGSPRMSLEQLQTLNAAGWDIGTNTQADVGITTFADDATCVADLAEAKAWLVENGMPRAVDHMALSNGLWSESRLAALQAAGMKTARGVTGSTIYTRFGYGDIAMTLPAYTCTRQTAGTLKSHIDLAILRGSSIIFYLHDVSSAPTGLGTDITIFTELIDYVQEKRNVGLIDVLTITDFDSIVSAARIGV